MNGIICLFFKDYQCYPVALVVYLKHVRPYIFTKRNLLKKYEVKNRHPYVTANQFGDKTKHERSLKINCIINVIDFNNYIKWLVCAVHPGHTMPDINSISHNSLQLSKTTDTVGCCVTLNNTPIILYHALSPGKEIHFPEQ